MKLELEVVPVLNLMRKECSFNHEAQHGTALLDEAIQLDLVVVINREEFVVLHGQNKPVLEES